MKETREMGFLHFPKRKPFPFFSPRRRSEDYA
jgi:hypothetical protein